MLTTGVSCPSGSDTQSVTQHSRVEQCWVAGKMGERAGLQKQLVARPLRGTAHGCQFSLPQAADLFFLRNLWLLAFSLACISSRLVSRGRASIRVWGKFHVARASREVPASLTVLLRRGDWRRSLLACPLPPSPLPPSWSQGATKTVCGRQPAWRVAFTIV